MNTRKIDLLQIRPGATWARRLMTASLFGILFFTLFPYWLDFSTIPDGNRNRFTLGGPLRFDGFLHSCLNILLFVPFGFALYAKSSVRSTSWWKSLSLAFGAGAVLSYAIEFTQMYMPSRDSEWDDVIANTLGSIIGMLIGLCLGDYILRKASDWENRIVSAVSMRLIGVLAVVYFGIWLGISIPLQKKTLLSNWDQTPYISIANDVRGTTPWDGQIAHLEIWDKSLTATEAEAVSHRSGPGLDFDAGALASYDLTQLPPIPGRGRSNPRLIMNRAVLPNPQMHELPGRLGPHSLISESSLSFLSEAVARSNQVTFHVDIVSKGGEGSNGTLVAISNLTGQTDFSLIQRGTKLVINLRTGLNGHNPPTDWNVEDLFMPNTRHSLIVSYDGSRGVLFVDGKENRWNFALGSGAGLVHMLIRTKTSEFQAYNGLYFSLVFLPLGFLLGLSFRIIPPASTLYKVGMIIGVFLSAVLLEELLARISGRPFSYAELFLSFALTTAGMVWINLDFFKRLK